MCNSSSMCSTLNACPRSSTNWRASATGRLNRSNGSASLRILAISASIAGKSSSESGPLGEVDVVIEAVRGGRAEGEPGAREEPQDRPGHDVGGRVAEDVERLAVPRGQEPQLDRPVAVSPFSSGPVEVDDRPVGDGGHGGVGEPLADPLGDLSGADPIGIFLDRPVRQLDLDHRSAVRAGPGLPWGERRRVEPIPSDPRRRPGTARRSLAVRRYDRPNLKRKAGRLPGHGWLAVVRDQLRMHQYHRNAI